MRLNNLKVIRAYISRVFEKVKDDPIKLGEYRKIILQLDKFLTEQEVAIDE